MVKIKATILKDDGDTVAAAVVSETIEKGTGVIQEMASAVFGKIQDVEIIPDFKEKDNDNEWNN